jgi:hypothetical protein
MEFGTPMDGRWVTPGPRIKFEIHSINIIFKIIKNKKYAVLVIEFNTS